VKPESRRVKISRTRHAPDPAEPDPDEAVAFELLGSATLEASDFVDAVDLCLTVRKLLSTLTAREEFYLVRRYGIGGGCLATYQELADNERISPETVRKVVDKALRKLRHSERRLELRDAWRRSAGRPRFST
jgi:RNA polymerase primary sigma factor